MFINLIRWREGNGWGWEDSKGVRRTTWRGAIGRGAGKSCRRNKAIIADPYCLSRITCKYLSCCKMAPGKEGQKPHRQDRRVRHPKVSDKSKAVPPANSTCPVTAFIRQAVERRHKKGANRLACCFKWPFQILLPCVIWLFPYSGNNSASWLSRPRVSPSCSASVLSGAPPKICP
jgi:hypothetical protein